MATKTKEPKTRPVADTQEKAFPKFAANGRAKPPPEINTPSEDEVVAAAESIATGIDTTPDEGEDEEGAGEDEDEEGSALTEDDPIDDTDDDDEDEDEEDEAAEDTATSAPSDTVPIEVDGKLALFDPTPPKEATLSRPLYEDLLAEFLKLDAGEMSIKEDITDLKASLKLTQTRKEQVKAQMREAFYVHRNQLPLGAQPGTSIQDKTIICELCPETGTVQMENGRKRCVRCAQNFTEDGTPVVQAEHPEAASNEVAKEEVLPGERENYVALFNALCGMLVDESTGEVSDPDLARLSQPDADGDLPIQTLPLVQIANTMANVGSRYRIYVALTPPYASRNAADFDEPAPEGAEVDAEAESEAVEV